MASKNLGNTPYERLANAIVLQGVWDYRKALRKLKKNPGNREVLDEALKLEKFFLSEWYQVLTAIDGRYLIDRIRKEIS